MSRDEMAKELHGYVMTCIEGYIKKSLSCLNLMAGTSCRKKNRNLIGKCHLMAKKMLHAICWVCHVYGADK